MITALFTKPLALELLGFDWYHSSGMDKCPFAVNGSCQQEQSLESVLSGGRQSSSLERQEMSIGCELAAALRGWNALPQSAVEATSLESFKASLPGVT